MLVPAAALAAAGWALHALGWSPVCKNLWSPSYVLLTAGLAGGLLHALHVSLDVQQPVRWLQTVVQPLHWLGLNAIACFFGDEFLSQAVPCVFWREPGQNLTSLLFRGFVWACAGDKGTAQLLFAAADSCFWTAVAGLLYRQGIFVKV